MLEPERGRWRMAVTVAVALILVSTVYLTARPREGLSVPERYVRDGMVPLETGLARLAHGMRGVWEGLGRWQQLEAENEALRQQLAEVREENQRLLDYKRENEALRAQLGMEPRPELKLVAAEVISRPLGNWWSTVVVGLGARDGIEPRMAVLAPAGVVGHVRSVTARSAEVVLLVDPQSAVGGQVVRSGELVVVEGMGPPGRRARVRPLSTTADLAVGDEVVTSGLSRLFPKGLPLGTIEEVRPGRYNLVPEGVLRPHVDFSHLEIVRVVLEPYRGEEEP